MSLQDDIFDVTDTLKDYKGMSKAFDRIIVCFNEMEHERLELIELRSAIRTLLKEIKKFS